MNPAHKVKIIVFGTALLCTAVGCAALTLGPARGVVLLGQPLDLRLPMQLDDTEDAASLCFAADVLYADTLLDPNRISVRFEATKGNSTAGATVRITASLPVDEPIVTVNFRSGCQQKSFKRYVLFADVATDLAKPEQAPASQTPPVAARTVSTSAVRPVAAGVPRPVRVAKTSPKSRLKLDALDLFIERDAVLRSSDELLTGLQADPQRRAAAVAMWRALNASPEEIMRDDASARRLENTVKSLYAVTTENQKGLIGLADKVQRAESERYASGLVYSLLALWLATLLGLVWVWRRMRRARVPDWSHGLDVGESVMPPAQPRPPAILHRPSPAGRPVGQRDLPVNAVAGLRSLDNEVLVDIGHQADFFVSLGQHERAIGILAARIAECGDSSPVVCLDLLKIYHALGRESEFEFMRAEFNNWFAGRVPKFSEFGDEGRSLERYPQVMDQIIALWPTPRVLEYIEDCIFHHSLEVADLVFDLQAYRDLLFLHGIATRISRWSDGETDSLMSGLIRVPARAKNAPVPAYDAPVSHRTVVPRGGAHLRGSWMRGEDASADPQAALDTRGASLSAMKLPPPGSSTVDVPAHPRPDREPSGLTDFRFLTLR